MDERIRTIIEAGTRAPSGDNCQPWRFQVADNRIDLFDVPERDTSLYNYKQRASLVAHGACIENMLIAAGHFGFATQVHYFPEPGNDLHVARITLSQTDIRHDLLYSAIPERTINRKKYTGADLSHEQSESLTSAGQGVSETKLVLHMDKHHISVAADVAGFSDRLVFENPSLHGFLFDHIRWSPEQALQSRDGMDILTLELAPQDRLFFPILKYFAFVRFIARFGATKLIAANAHKLMMSASAIGIISIEDNTPEAWIRAGRLLERVWLEATRLGLSFHLMTGITFLVQRLRDGDAGGLMKNNLELLRGVDSLLNQLSDGTSTIALLFRIGFSGLPSARSLRRTADIEH